MTKIRVIGLISVIIGILGITYLDRSDFQFLFGILTGIGIGWLLRGQFMVISKKEKESLGK
ncbi:hypothetical protein ML462_15340 [Gramella lutea]|uniref:Uncharacterized protein n=1 Tax=Christiangramia lutea TaxID=1607951 RepID=A0A9X2ABU3_9FLAO|nr:hypothetical protein [Christiangramia lutea]MCH4824546.1 hypothetical protein [Christiangramia lutea]